MKDKKEKNSVMGYVIYAIAGVVLAIILNIFLGLVIVNGHSMDSTLRDKQILIMYKNTENLKAGDIVVAKIKRFDNGEDETIIKRVIATEGQTVEIKNGKVLVDDVEIKEDYINEPMDIQSYDKVTVPKGEIYVMGDNRNHSLDSRIQGTISLDNVEGRILFK